MVLLIFSILISPTSRYAVLLFGHESFCLNQPDRVLGREVAYTHTLKNTGYFVVKVSPPRFFKKKKKLLEGPFDFQMVRKISIKM